MRQLYLSSKFLQSFIEDLSHNSCLLGIFGRDENIFVFPTLKAPKHFCCFSQKKQELLATISNTAPKERKSTFQRLFSSGLTMINCLNRIDFTVEVLLVVTFQELQFH